MKNVPFPNMLCCISSHDTWQSMMSDSHKNGFELWFVSHLKLFFYFRKLGVYSSSYIILANFLVIGSTDHLIFLYRCLISHLKCQHFWQNFRFWVNCCFKVNLLARIQTHAIISNKFICKKSNKISCLPLKYC